MRAAPRNPPRLSGPFGGVNPSPNSWRASGDNQRGEEAERMENSRHSKEFLVLSVALSSLLLAIGDVVALMLFSIATSSQVSYNAVSPMIDSKIITSSSSSSGSSHYGSPTPSPTTSAEGHVKAKQSQALATGICLAISGTLAVFTFIGMVAIYSRSLKYSTLAFFKDVRPLWWLPALFVLFGLSVFLFLLALFLAMLLLYPNYDSDLNNNGLAAGVTGGAMGLALMVTTFIIYMS